MSDFNCKSCGCDLSMFDGRRSFKCPNCNTLVLRNVSNRCSGVSANPQSNTKSCPFCKEAIAESAVKCKHCGEVVDVLFRDLYRKKSGTTSRIAYILLAIFFGAFGIHNFYAKRNGRAMGQLLCLLLFFLVIPPFILLFWVIIDIISVNTDGEGNLMT